MTGMANTIMANRNTMILKAPQPGRPMSYAAVVTAPTKIIFEPSNVTIIHPVTVPNMSASVSAEAMDKGEIR